MSWLAQGLTNSVTGKISQISGQLKEILTESTQDEVDPLVQMKVMEEKIKEMEKHIETLNMECTRWEDESNELTVKCKTYEAQLEQRQAEFRQQLLLKESQLVEMRNQLNSNAAQLENISPAYHQKSSLMEEFEEIMPSSELNDYIHLQKEIKRLKDDNVHLNSENKELLNKVKLMEASLSSSDRSENSINISEALVESLKQEKLNLRSQLESDKDKHQGEIVGIQQQYQSKLKHQANEYEEEIAKLKSKLEQVEADLQQQQAQISEKQAETASSLTDVASSSNKSEDGWCLNGEDVNLNDIEKNNNNDNNNLNERIVAEKDNEIQQLKIQVETFEADLEAANQIIQKLKSQSRASSESPQKSPEHQQLVQARDEIAKQLADAQANINDLAGQLEAEKRSKESVLGEKESQLKELVDELDRVRLELKQQQQSIQQEKMMQMQEMKQEQIEIERLKKENTELQSKLDEKLNEIKHLGDQINDLNLNLNTLKSNDSDLFVELKTKTEQFVMQLDKANSEIAELREERERMREHQKQFEFVLEEKTREASSLKADVQMHVQHIAAQSQAIDKLQEDLKQQQQEQEQQPSEQQLQQLQQTSEELNGLKARYNELYSYLEKKNEESLSYYNEIQRLNGVLSEQGGELQSLKNMNENLSEQYENLSREFQLEQKMVEDLNQQIYDLNKSLLDTSNAFRQQTPERNAEAAAAAAAATASLAQLSIVDKLEAETQTDVVDEPKQEKEVEKEEVKVVTVVEKIEDTTRIQELEMQYKSIVEQLEQRIDALQRDKNELVDENRRIAAEMSARLEQAQSYYEDLFKKENENFRAILSNEEQHKSKLTRELERLKEHLVTMSDSYNNEAIQAEEREKQLRTALADAQAAMQKQGANLETSSKEMEVRVAQLVQQNQDLVETREKLKDRVKQAEDSLSHQVKVTKNLELVLERLQNEKDSQHTLELAKLQQIIKDQAKSIHSLQTDAQNYQKKIDELNAFVDQLEQMKIQIMRKDELIKTLNDQISTKDSLVESLDKRVNETIKVNESYIEKEMIKNLIIGYIKVSQAQEKKQVLRLIATMLNFTPAEIEQAESGTESAGKWFSLLKTSPSKASPSKPDGGQPSSSFADLLIQYVDRESKPKGNLKFDINDPVLNAKKTDNHPMSGGGAGGHMPSLLLTDRALDMGSSESAIKFFNNNLVGADSKLTERTNSQANQARQSHHHHASNLSSLPPNVTNSILEEILK